MRRDRRIGLVSAFAGVVLVLATLGFVLADRALTGRAGLLLLAGVALIVVLPAQDPRATLDLVSGRRRLTLRPAGAVAVLLTAAVLGVLIAANVVASRATAAADLTSGHLYTLTPESDAAVDALKGQLTLTGFYRPDQQDAERQAQTLVDRYQQRGGGRVVTRFLDPDQHQAEALDLGVKAPGSLVLQYGTRHPVVLDPVEQSESDVTQAIRRLESTRTPVVCWATGDGERALHDASQVSGYSTADALLQGSSYRVQEVSLGDQGALGSCDVLAIMQLGQPPAPAETTAVQTYLAGGGKLLIALDPWPDPTVLASANALIQPYGLAFDGGLVIEPDPDHAAAGDDTVPLITDLGSSPITRDLAGSYVFFPQSTPVRATPMPATTVANLATTSPRSFDIPTQRTSLTRRATDGAGPFVLMRTAQRSAPSGRTTRIVVAGTSALAENRTLPPLAGGSNGDLLRASLDWLSQQDQLIGLPPPAPAPPPFTLDGAALGVNVAVAGVLLPLLVAAVVLLVGARRRQPTRY